MALPLYPIKADPATLSGIKMTLGKGTIEGEDNDTSVFLNHTAIEFEGMENGVMIESGMNVSKTVISNVSFTHIHKADSSKILNKSNNDYSEQTVDRLVFNGVTSLDLNQLRSEQEVFEVNASSTLNLNASSLTLNAPSLTLNASSLKFDPSLMSTSSGGGVEQYILIYVENMSYKIPLHAV